MVRTRIKLCGMTDPAQAHYAVECGVDAIGMIMYADSPRRVALEQAIAIRAVVPAFVSLVGVFVDAQPELINTLAVQCGLDCIQLHGDESPEILAALNRPVIKAVRARDVQSVQSAISAFKHTRAILLDPFDPNQHGGTGKRLDYSLWPARGATEPCANSSVKPTVELPRMILAGGLGPDNLFNMLSQFKPYAVDLNSGVEQSPGQKDLQKVVAAVREVQRYDLKCRS